MLNRVIIAGRITKNPELKRTGSGTAVTSFTVACERDFKDQNGKKETDFLDVVVWRNTAEFVSKYFSKGRMITVEGRLQIRNWKDQNGNNRKNTEIVAENIYFGDSKKESVAFAPSVSYGGTSPDGIPSNFAEIEEDGEGLPF